MAQPQFDERLLIEQARSGDIAAFNGLVLAYQDRIYTITYRIMGETHSAADMAQDAFITAFRKLDTYRGGSFAGWLGRIATNTCYDELRRRQRRPADYLDDLPGGDSDDGPHLPADTPTPEQEAQRSELSQALQDCINRLTPDQRVVLIMSDIQGMAYQEIADVTDVSLGTIKSRLSRARLAMRRCLQGAQELLPAEYRLFSDNP